MSLYNLLFGRNPNTDIVLALIGLKECDVERFRDCGIDYENKQIWVFTRTGGGNRESYPNELLTSNPYYLYDEDDDGDYTYAHYYFKFPDEIADDIMSLQDIRRNGISAKLIQWICNTLEREPTENDKWSWMYDHQSKVVKRVLADCNAISFNGHTIVPLNDYAMEQLLKAAEMNNGEFLPYWIGVYSITVERDCPTWKFENNKSDIEREMSRVKIDTNWKVDWPTWERYKAKFGNRYPKAIAYLDEQYQKQR
jgi:hypothetical protein